MERGNCLETDGGVDVPFTVDSVEEFDSIYYCEDSQLVVCVLLINRRQVHPVDYPLRIRLSVGQVGDVYAFKQVEDSLLFIQFTEVKGGEGSIPLQRQYMVLSIQGLDDVEAVPFAHDGSFEIPQSEIYGGYLMMDSSYILTHPTIQAHHVLYRVVVEVDSLLYLQTA